MDNKTTVTFVKNSTPYVAGDVVTDEYKHLEEYLKSGDAVEGVLELSSETQETEANQNG